MGKHTQGPVEIDRDVIFKPFYGSICEMIGRPEDFAANAELIAEAFNVATETGMTPRQLAEQLAANRAGWAKCDAQRVELLAALKEAAEAIEEEVSAGDDDHPIIRAHRNTAKKARATIAKVEGQS